MGIGAQAVSAVSCFSGWGTFLFMRIFRRPSFTLWLVPTDGQIRRVRFSLGKLVAVAIICGGTLGGAMFLVGDYARIQLLRAKSYISLRLAERERQHLETANQVLQDRLRDFQEQHVEVLTVQKDIKAQLEGLRAIVRASESMGIIAPPAKAKPRIASTGPAGNSAVAAKAASNSAATAKKDSGTTAVVSESAAKDHPGLGGAESDRSPMYSAYSSSPKAKPLGSASQLPGVFKKNTAGDSGEGMLPILKEARELIQRLHKAPLYLPSASEVLSGFGYRESPFGDGVKFHEGLDFCLPYKSDVVSAGAGVVSEVKNHPTYGLMIDIDHDTGVTTRYAHLHSAFVKVGQSVIAGDRIGLSGSSGRSTGPHLHYEVRVRDVPIDPRRVFALSLKLAQVLG